MKKLIISLVTILLFSFSAYSQTDTIFYENGNKKEVLSFNENLELDGKCYTWSIDGILTGEASYKDGVKHGVWKIWRNDGTLAYEMYYKKGEKVGEWKSYNEDGQLLAIRKF